MAKMTGTQKAAVLMVALGDDVAASIFKYLEDDEIQTVSKEVFAFGREKAGEDVIGSIVGAIPGLGQFV